MFRVAFVTVTIIAWVNQVSSSKTDSIIACMSARADQCFPYYIIGMTGASPTYRDMCAALGNLNVCFGANLLCEDETFDGICFGTLLENFLEDTNVCGDGSGTGSLEEAALAKRCLHIMVEVLTVNPDTPCLFLGEFAKCILTKEQSLQGNILETFRETIRWQLRLNLPHAFGDTTVPFCSGLNATFADLLRENGKHTKCLC